MGPLLARWCSSECQHRGFYSLRGRLCGGQRNEVWIVGRGGKDGILRGVSLRDGENATSVAIYFVNWRRVVVCAQRVQKRVCECTFKFFVIRVVNIETDFCVLARTDTNDLRICQFERTRNGPRSDGIVRRIVLESEWQIANGSGMAAVPAGDCAAANVSQNGKNIFVGNNALIHVICGNNGAVANFRVAVATEMQERSVARVVNEYFAALAGTTKIDEQAETFPDVNGGRIIWVGGATGRVVAEQCNVFRGISIVLGEYFFDITNVINAAAQSTSGSVGIIDAN